MYLPLALCQQYMMLLLALVLLTDLAHNLLADFHHQALSDSPFSDFGPKRIVRDLLSIPGLLTFGDSQLQRIELWQNHPYAKSMLSCLQRLIETPTGMPARFSFLR